MTINAVVTHSEAVKGCLTKSKLDEHTTSKKPRTTFKKESSLSCRYSISLPFFSLSDDDSPSYLLTCPLPIPAVFIFLVSFDKVNSRGSMPDFATAWAACDLSFAALALVRTISDHFTGR